MPQKATATQNDFKHYYERLYERQYPFAMLFFPQCSDETELLDGSVIMTDKRFDILFWFLKYRGTHFERHAHLEVDGGQ